MPACWWVVLPTCGGLCTSLGGTRAAPWYLCLPGLWLPGVGPSKDLGANGSEGVVGWQAGGQKPLSPWEDNSPHTQHSLRHKLAKIFRTEGVSTRPKCPRKGTAHATHRIVSGRSPQQSYGTSPFLGQSIKTKDQRKVIGKSLTLKN